MSSVVLILRILLAGVFVTAGVAKLSDLATTRATVEAFGVPRRLAQQAGTVLPFAELISAVALLPQATARWGGVAAAVLLVVFIAGIAYALSQGLRPDCNCFGQVSSAQIGPQTLARNGVLLVLAGIVVWKAPGSSMSAWTTSHAAANLVAAIAVLVAALLAIAAFRYRQLAAAVPAATSDAQRLPGLPIGSPAPTFELPDLDGETVSLASLVQRRVPTVLVFASQTCGPCMALMPEIARWTSAIGESINLVVIESGVEDAQALREQLPGAGELRALIEPDRDIAASYLVHGTPTGIGLDADGRIAGPPALGSDAVEALVRAALNEAQGPRRGEVAQPVGSAS